jgi:hypothetical protein
MKRAVAVATLIAAASCGASGPSRVRVGLFDAEVEPTSLSLQLSLGICHARDRRVKVAETDKAVKVTITAENPGAGPHPMCADRLVVPLKHPLGGRRVVNGATGRSVPVSFLR